MGELGTLVRTRRKELARSLRAVADDANISFVTVRDIERGDIGRPTPETLQGLARALNIPYRDLALAAYGANGDTPPTPPKGESPCPPEIGRESKDRSASTS